MTNRKDPNIKIGIALGSGAARGWAHIGVLNALKDMGVEPDIVAGCSIGAYVGAAYASDQLDVLEEWTKTLTWKGIINLFDLSLSKGGLIQGEKPLHFIRSKSGDPDINTLSRQFAAVATELNTGREVWLREGSLYDNVRASIALPGIISPAKINDKWLIDGGLVNPVPVSLCRAMGADIVIAVNLNGDLLNNNQANNLNISSLTPAKEQSDETIGNMSIFERISAPIKEEVNKKKELFTSKFFSQNEQSPGLIDVMASAINIMQDRITRSRLAGDLPDIIISPKFPQLGLLEFDKADIAITEGRNSV
jgi:NTE family protein